MVQTPLLLAMTAAVLGAGVATYDRAGTRPTGESVPRLAACTNFSIVETDPDPVEVAENTVFQLNYSILNAGQSACTVTIAAAIGPFPSTDLSAIGSDPSGTVELPAVADIEVVAEYESGTLDGQARLLVTGTSTKKGTYWVDIVP